MIRNILLGVTALALLTSCGSGSKKTNNEGNEKIPVKVQTLESVEVERTLDYTANLQADEQVYYAPASSGRIHKIYVEVGDRVKKGQLLVEMDKCEYLLAWESRVGGVYFLVF